jgi:hypothetical protein
MATSGSSFIHGTSVTRVRSGDDAASGDLATGICLPFPARDPRHRLPPHTRVGTWHTWRYRTPWTPSRNAHRTRDTTRPAAYAAPTRTSGPSREPWRHSLFAARGCAPTRGPLGRMVGPRDGETGMVTVRRPHPVSAGTSRLSRTRLRRDDVNWRKPPGGRRADGGEAGERRWRRRCC